jgi:hypothetical protein
VRVVLVFMCGYVRVCARVCVGLCECASEGVQVYVFHFFSPVICQYSVGVFVLALCAGEACLRGVVRCEVSEEVDVSCRNVRCVRDR